MTFKIKTLEDFIKECEDNILRLKDQINSTDDPELRRVFDDLIQFRRGEIQGVNKAIEAITCIIGNNEVSSIKAVHLKGSSEDPVDRASDYQSKGYSREEALDLAIKDYSFGEEY